MQQVTKHGTISILKSGDILMDFKGDKYLIGISGDSETISLFDRSSTSIAQCKYSRAQTPSSLSKKYKYASRFVELVRTKTPKIIFYSPQAKCILMENSPHPDFQMVFYNGVKAQTITSLNKLEITIPEALTQQFCDRRKELYVYTIDMTNGEPEAAYVQIFKHAQECLRQCLELEQSSRFDTCTKYPLILKSSQSITEANTTNTPIVVNPTMSTYSNQQSIRSVKSMHYSNSSVSSHSPEVASHYLDNVGWCISTNDKQFGMLFNDGIRVSVHSKTQIVTFTLLNSESKRYN
jgi:Polo-like Kinase 4 Polo Box 2